MKPPELSERAIQRQIVATLRKLGWTVYVLSRVGTAKGNPGLPDLFIRHTARKRHAWCEVKRPNGKLSAAQQAFQNAATAAGEEFWVLRELNDAVMVHRLNLYAQ
jgi:VRR-NUC domain-containing protein